ncbi:hypothetical protein PUV47_07145 [Pseudovibrio exalbescens]|uniref:hypothetical protein n=1 Tax=Pseudovibrio exalbescens TaxID=197461 RepID=UPI002365C8D0|nr:hypothetical protein [Pseudovibrio exalbescens]MDD7909690.1 hypothetical protein [Pseudovibrio exalbescens]
MAKYDLSFLCETDQPETWQVGFQKPSVMPVASFPIQHGSSFKLLDYDYTQDTQIVLQVPRGLVFLKYNAGDGTWNIGSPGVLYSFGRMGVSILVEASDSTNNNDENPLNLIN